MAAAISHTRMVAVISHTELLRKCHRGVGERVLQEEAVLAGEGQPVTTGIHPGKWNGLLSGRLYMVPSGSANSGSGAGRGTSFVATHHCWHTAAKWARSASAGSRRRTSPASSSGMSDHDGSGGVLAIGRANPVE
nr:unnamed protein product [Digitaria exilis]